MAGLDYCPRCGFDLSTPVGGELWAFRQTVAMDAPAGKTIAWLERGKRMLDLVDYRTVNGVFYRRVSLHYLGRILTGWVRDDRVEPYEAPSEENDPANEQNRQKVFDFSQPVLRHPQDPEIEQAILAGRAAQYIDLTRAGFPGIKKNLCGPIACAAIAGEDVIPLCRNWVEKSSAYGATIASLILRNDYTTGLQNLEDILRLQQVEVERLSYSSSNFPSASRIADRRGVYGVGINQSDGALNPKGVRHWVVLLDVMAVGTDGWVRLYNPFNNRDETYLYSEFEANFFPGTALWVKSIGG